jgi:hypothetical protein
MKSKELRFEIQFYSKGNWIEVSETVFLRRLLDSFYPVTPVIVKMLKGGEVAAASASFRIKIRPGAKGILIPEKFISHSNGFQLKRRLKTAALARR